MPSSPLQGSQHRHSSDACGHGEILECSHTGCWGSKHSWTPPRNKEKERVLETMPLTARIPQ